MNAWVPLAPAELAYLAAAEDDAPTPLDRLGLAGAWLRHPQVRADGERRLAARIAAVPEVTAAGWVLVTAAAQALVRSTSGSVLALRGGAREAFLVTAGGTQLVVDAERLALRRIESELRPAELAAELEEGFAPDSVDGIRWSAAGDEEHARWAGGQWLHGERSIPMSGTDALAALSAFALEVADVPL